MGSKLKKNELVEFRDSLLQLRARLLGDLTQLTDEALRNKQQRASMSSVPLHMADVGTDNFEQEFTLTLLENEEDAVRLVDHALARIENGAFGTCEECAGAIPKARLKAIPYTPHCVGCARTHEQHR